MIELTDSQCFDAGANAPTVIKVQTSSCCTRETHQKNDDLNQQHLFISSLFYIGKN